MDEGTQEEVVLYRWEELSNIKYKNGSYHVRLSPQMDVVDEHCYCINCGVLTGAAEFQPIILQMSVDLQTPYG